MKILTRKYWWLSAAVGVVCVIWQCVCAQEQPAPDAGIPVPKGARFADTHTSKIADYRIESKLYYCPMPLADIVVFYKKYFEKAGFVLVIDSSEEKPKRLLRYKNNTDVVSIALRPKDQETQIVIARYRQPFGALPPEKTMPYWKDLIGELPKEDQGGQDLAVVPRPPESVRLGGGQAAGMAFVVYHSGQSAQAVTEFYKTKMVQPTWALRSATDMQQITGSADPTMRKSLSKIRMPFPDITFGELAKGGSVLAYQGEWGQAEIGIVNSGVDGRGSLVYIKYAEKTAEK